SNRATLSFGRFDTHTDSSTAIQSGEPGYGKTASGLSRSIGILTPDVFTPGRGALAGGCEPTAVQVRTPAAMENPRRTRRTLGKSEVFAAGSASSACKPVLVLDIAVRHNTCSCLLVRARSASAG